MTRITIEIAPEQGQYRLWAAGHAGYCPGQDIVCASVSALVYALVGGLENCREACCQLVYRVESGLVQVDCHSRSPQIQGMFTVAAVGLAQIAKAYPDHVAVRWTEGEPAG